ncbi:uncharacterized protein LOC132550437 [Ylistrum balloti]|uniref:uncharacterized protein LOC132550437 n=1 Tax=Ylistrum balloti TaxID=509963 RepID=UPI0029058DC1|nr:uncharacterized protein LOC132550437 [Ylistrum balloti]
MSGEQRKLRFSLPNLPEHPGMKEHTYGWYPAVRDVYTERRLGMPTTYDLEAMYKFRDSKYYTAPNPPSPRTPKPYRPTPTPTKHRPTSSTSSKSGRESGLQVRAKSAPIYNFKRVPRLELPTPLQCWAGSSVSETEVGETPSSQTLPTPTPPPPKQETPKEDQKQARRDRIKSAVIRRDRAQAPKRPVKSAGPTRSPVEVYQAPVPPKEGTSPAPPTSPAPEVYYIPEEPYCRPTTAENYDKNVKEYGWRFEVHGDPYKLKKKTLSKRLPYYVTVPEPEIEKDGPKVKMENMETFFYNTIPRRPATFTIHKEWISETIHAQRMELQKREGIKHRWKNFSFVY